MDSKERTRSILSFKQTITNRPVLLLSADIYTKNHLRYMALEKKHSISTGRICTIHNTI